MTICLRRLGLAAAALLTFACAIPALADPLAAMLAVERARPVPPVFERETFLTEPLLTSVTIAPDGGTVAFLKIAAGQYSLWLQSTVPGAAPRRILPRTDAREVMWSRDSRWLILIAGDKIQMLSPAGDRGSGIAATLGGPTELRLLDLDPWKPGVLLVDQESGRWRLWHAGPGGVRRMLVSSDREILGVALGRDGRAAFLKLVDGDRHLIAVRGTGGRFRTIATCVAMMRCDLIGITPDGRRAYVAGDGPDGRRAILQLDPDGRWTPIHGDPTGEADLDGLVLDRATGVPQIASYRGGPIRRYALDATTAGRLARLAEMPDAVIETSTGAWLVRERDARLQGNRWHLYDPVSGAIHPLLDDRAKRLSPDTLARVIPFVFPASDGMPIHGLLSVPPGRDPMHVPLVTIVHGGPWSHDEPDYSALTQLLVNRGYAVFRPQFRGSTGYGRAYMLAANGDFGNGRVQRDIEEGTQYLLAHGIGDPKHTAIMGASFGGYSTLQALSNGSALYRAGIAIVPPVDFGWTSRWGAARGDFGKTQGMALEQSLRLLALDPTDAAIAGRLHRESPLANVAAMRTPLLLIASGRDERVPIRSVIDYAARLRLQGAPAQIVVSRNQPHASSDPMVLRSTLFLTETMLTRHLGGPAPLPPKQDLRDWMAGNLVVH